jgi:diguanylate cyclase (GGDEF)-like protein
MREEGGDGSGKGASPAAGDWPPGCWPLLVTHLAESDDFVLFLDRQFGIVQANPAFTVVILGGLRGGTSLEASLTEESRGALRALCGTEDAPIDEFACLSIQLEHGLDAGTRTVAYRFRPFQDGWLVVGRDLSDQLEIVKQMGVLVEELESRVHEERALSASLRTLAERDPLTGLANRRSFESDLDGCCARHETADLEFSLLCVDVDRYKQVNDCYGHGVGDRVLVEIARVLEHSIRDEDSAARLGGDEFVVIARHVSGTKALDVAERIRTNVEALDLPEVVDGVSVSIGVASTHADAPERAGMLLKRADEALYNAKRCGRNCTRVAP